jgi:hypothetical protein
VLEGIPLVGLTAPTVLFIGVLLILTGRLVPRRTYQDMKEDRDHWRTAHAVSEEARIAKSRQLDVVLEVSETVKDVLQALQRPGEGGSR